MERHEVERRVLDAVGRAMGEFQMLRPGDRIAVGVSGGKDSLCLLHALTAYRRRAPFGYDLVAVTIEQGKFKIPIREIERQIRSLGVPWVLEEDLTTLRLVNGGVVHGCDVCSRHRRRLLYRIAAEQECTVLALGHTADDCAEALLRNILFNGRIASLPPVAAARKGPMRLIRPLVFVTEDLTTEYARAQGFLTVGCVCADKEGVRREIREFLSGMRQRHRRISDSITAALKPLAHTARLRQDRTLERPTQTQAQGDPSWQTPSSSRLPASPSARPTAAPSTTPTARPSPAM